AFTVLNRRLSKLSRQADAPFLDARAQREIVSGGEVAAARALRKGLVLADGYRARDAARAARAEWVAMGCHDQIKSAAETLAERVRAMEPHLGAPLQRSKREALNDALPGIKRVVEDAAHRTAVEQRRALTKRRDAPNEEVEMWRRQLIDAVRQSRTAAKERVDVAHKRARAEVERLVTELSSVPGPIRKRLLEVAESRVESAVKAGSEGRMYRGPSAARRLLNVMLAIIAVVLVFFLGVATMSAGMGFAGAAVGALALRGAGIPVVLGGLLMGVVGCTFGALATDVMFGRIGDWKSALEEGLLGAVSPLQGLGEAVPARDVANALQYVELPPLSPDRVATPAAPGALRVALRGPAADLAQTNEEITGRIRIPRNPNRG
ncbi:MAG: hypothetical protein ABMA64_20850, partial [Myxococcota bacterium]